MRHLDNHEDTIASSRAHFLAQAPGSTTFFPSPPCTWLLLDPHTKFRKVYKDSVSRVDQSVSFSETCFLVPHEMWPSIWNSDPRLRGGYQQRKTWVTRDSELKSGPRPTSHRRQQIDDRCKELEEKSRNQKKSGYLQAYCCLNNILSVMPEMRVNRPRASTE